MADLDRDETLKEEVDQEEKAAGSGDTETAEETDASGDTESTEDDADPDAGEENGEASEDAPEGKKKSRLFSKKEKKKDKKDQQIEELTDRLMRQMAEFDNFRKRTEREKAQMFDSGAGDIIEKILPVIDDMERGLAALNDEEKETSFAKGMEMIYKKFIGILNNAGVEPIDAAGKEFDPNFHNAVMQSPSDEVESGYVVQELQKGYMYKEKVLRHSMVIVAE
ncbi:MAG TPA: nucleotide exchange factor GrpE [Candidatus Scybalocola faecigallinarum]|uniref:Protein GrpE n=1 Tax=Candidatus Scybalocola faecigallinarum TaxID=2840941 RepID=A0A9D1JRI5_9FIRM|nr:nucleotide exchange factor GrpE [Candidatus Scybalocola faecigallinarum]